MKGTDLVVMEEIQVAIGRWEWVPIRTFSDQDRDLAMIFIQHIEQVQLNGNTPVLDHDIIEVPRSW